MDKMHRDEKHSPTSTTSSSLSSLLTQLNLWIDQHLLQQSSTVLPSNTQQKKSSSFLKSRPFRLLVLFYILFSVLLTAAHFSSWVVSKGRQSVDKWSYQRTYDPRKLLSLLLSFLLYINSRTNTHTHTRH